MKIQCNVCEAAEAAVLCCADEAALCLGCDNKVHAANKLASKHQRVPLSTSSSKMPKCDICQETVGYFFCLEDRALLCRKCDVAIHTANTHVSAHQRFLLNGVRVGLEATEPRASTSSGKTRSSERNSEPEMHSLLRKSAPVSSDAQCNKVLPTQGGLADFMAAKSPMTGGSATGGISQWQLHECLGINDYDRNYYYQDNGSFKADCGKLGDSDGYPILRAAEEELYGDDCLGQVPEIPSQPTSSGLHWPKVYQNLPDSSAVIVPDISSSPLLHFGHHRHPQGSNLKRRRQF